MDGPFRPALAPARRYREAMGGLDLGPAGPAFVQTIFVHAETPAWAAPLPGTYTVVHGALPAALRHEDAASLRAGAGHRLADMATDPLGLRAIELAPAGPRRLGPLRLLGTQVKTAVYQRVAADDADPMMVWRRPFRAVVRAVEPRWCPDGHLTAFFTRVWDWAAARDDPAAHRAMWVDGCRALWALCRQDSEADGPG